MGWYANLQVYAPGGVLNPVTGNWSNGLTNTAGTPNLLIDLSDQCYQAQWTDLMQGGLDSAEFDMRMPYESTTDLIAGNWVIFGCLGASLSAHASAGASSITVSNLWNQAALAANRQQVDFKLGDLIMISDGTNAELFICQTVTNLGGNSWTVNLGPAWSNVQVEEQCALAQPAAQGANSVLVNRKTAPSGHTLSGSDHIAIASDPYTISSITGPDGNGNYTLNLGSSLSASYATGTPVSAAGTNVTSVFCTTVQGIPIGNTVWIDSGSPLKDQGTVTGKPGNGSITISPHLTNAHGAGAPILFQMNGTLQNNYAVGQTIITRVQYQGYITQRIHSTTILNQFSLKCSGFFSRYNSIVDSSTVQNKDAAAMMIRDLASYGPTLPAILVNDTQAGNWLAESNGIPINIQQTDSQFIELLDTILRQENGNSVDVQYAVWVAADRLVRHLPIATSAPYASGHGPADGKVTPTIYLSLSDGGNASQNPTQGDTINSVQNTDEDITSLINAAIVTGVAAPSGSQVYNINTTTLAQVYNAGQTTMTVTSIPATWPATGGGLYLRFRGISGTFPQYNGHSGDQVSLTAFSKSLGIGQDVELITELSGHFNPGTTVFTVDNASIFSSGQEITITPTGASEETLTIQSINYVTNHITTTTAAKKTHNPGDGCALAANGGGSGPRIIVYQRDSIEKFGWFEGTLTSEDIYDENKLAQWGAKQLSLTAWPAVACQVLLANTAARISGRDLVQIEGFNPGFPDLIQNVISVQYNATAADQNVSATLNLGIMHSTALSTLKDLGKERTEKIKYHVPRHNSNKNAHVHGHAINQSDLQQITIDAGTVQVNGQFYQIPALTTLVPDGESRWGASCGPGVAAPGIVELPYIFASGRKLYAHGSIWSIDQQGDAPKMEQQFTGIPLWKVRAANGSIVGFEPLFETRGVGQVNLPSVVTPPAPTFTGTSVSNTSQSSGMACDVSVSTSVTNFPTDNASSYMKVYARTNGTSVWSHKLTVPVVGLPQPQPTQAVSFVIHGVPSGETIDIGMSFDGLAGEGSVGIIQSAFAASQAFLTVNGNTVVDVNGNIIPNPFGASSGVRFYNADGTLTNFSGAVSSAQTYTTETSLSLYLDFIPAALNTGTFEMGIGNVTNGYSILWTTSGSPTANITRYKAGVATQIGVQLATTSFTPNQTHRVRLCVDFFDQTVEAVIEQYGNTIPGAQPPMADASGPWTSFSGNSIPIWVNAAGTTGRIQNLQIMPRSLFLSESQPVIATIDPSYLTSGHYLIANTVDNRAIQAGAVGAGNINGLTGTGAVSLDNVPDGTTYGRTKLTGLTSGFAAKTGSLGAFTIKGVGDASTLNLDTEIADGTTYKRILATQLNGTTGNIQTPFSGTAVAYASDGSIGSFPGAPISTTAVFPIQASFPIIASGWIIPGSTSSAFRFLIGNETNGLGINWTAAGVFALVTFKAGTATVGSSIGTITRDSNYHWVSVSLTPGATPGTSDAWVIYLDKLTSSGTTGSSIITWGSTAAVTFDGGTSGGKLFGFHIHSTQP